MTIGNENDLDKLKEIGGIVARVLHAMGEALRPGVSTAELDALGKVRVRDVERAQQAVVAVVRQLEDEGVLSTAPEAEGDTVVT